MMTLKSKKNAGGIYSRVLKRRFMKNEFLKPGFSGPYDLLMQPTRPIETIWVRIIPKKVQYPGNR